MRQSWLWESLLLCFHDITKVLVRFSLAILQNKLFYMEIQRKENNSSRTDNVNGRNSDHSDRRASNRVLPFSIEAILSAPHPSPLSSLEKFIRSNLQEDISATEKAEGGNDENIAVI